MKFVTMSTFCALPALMLASALALGACSSRPEPAPEPTLADFMEQSAQVYADEAAARQALADRWRDGNQLIADGNRQQRDAADTIKKAERDVKRAEREIKKHQDRLAKAQKSLTDAQGAQAAGAEKLAAGQQMKADAEAQFRAAYPEAPLP